MKNRTETPHTPTPWHFSAGDFDYSICSRNEIVGSCSAYKDKFDMNKDIDAANAAYIVRAVNSHDELVKSLRAILSYQLDVEEGKDDKKRYQSLRDQAHRAIAKAEARK